MFCSRLGTEHRPMASRSPSLPRISLIRLPSRLPLSQSRWHECTIQWRGHPRAEHRRRNVGDDPQSRLRASNRSRPAHLREPQGRVLICAQIAAPLWLSKKLDLIYVERLCFFPEEKTTDRIARDVIQPGIPAEMTWKHPMPLPLHDRMRVLCSRTADVRLAYWGVA
jgi:hypothetical protein